MKKFVAWLFGFAALALAGAAVAAVVLMRDAPPVMAEYPAAAQETAERFMAAICAGEFGEAQTMLLGQPELGADWTPTQKVGAQIWTSIIDSSDYMMQGECYPVEGGVAQNVTFLCLEISSVTENLGVRTERMLEERVAQAENAADIYDEQNNYREELIFEILEEVMEQALWEDSRYVEQELTLNLVWREGQWWILPEQKMLSALFGGIR